jgi:hypothetical protein
MDQVLHAMRECMESIDSSGGLIKLRRDLLLRFAQDPAATADDLRHQAINSHLRLGFHFKNLGLASMTDALREFRHVLRLDPRNPKASQAVAELRKRAEDSGVGMAAAPPPPAAVPTGAPDRGGAAAAADDADAAGRTMVMPAGGRPPRAAEPAPAAPPPVAPREPRPSRPPREKRPPREPRPPRPAAAGVLDGLRRRPGLVAGVLGAVVVVAVTVALVSRRRPPAPPATVAVQVASEPAGAQVWMRRAGSADFAPTGRQTDCVLADLAAGAWEFKLSLAGYADTVLAVTAPAGGPASVRGRLRALVVAGGGAVPGGASAAAPGAKGVVSPASGGADSARAAVAAAAEPVRLNGQIRVRVTPDGASVLVRQAEAPWRPVGPAPVTTELLPAGSWEVRAEKPGFAPAMMKVKVIGGQTVVARLTLVLSGGEVAIGATESVPLDIDQQRVGSTPWSGRLEPGEHTITVRSDDYAVQAASLVAADGSLRSLPASGSGGKYTSFRVTIAQGDRLRIDLQLKKKPRT